jgi:hypothetical protein
MQTKQVIPGHLLAVTRLTHDSTGHVKSYIILPPTVFGIAHGMLVDAGIQNPYSMKIPFAIQQAIRRKAGGVVGEGMYSRIVLSAP